jgi:hypothetical protein
MACSGVSGERGDAIRFDASQHSHSLDSNTFLNTLLQ